MHLVYTSFENLTILRINVIHNYKTAFCSFISFIDLRDKWIFITNTMFFDV